MTDAQPDGQTHRRRTTALAVLMHSSSRIEHVHKCTQELGGRCEDRSQRHDIDIYYSEIVHCLMTAAKETIPLIPKSALKHYWSAELD